MQPNHADAENIPGSRLYHVLDELSAVSVYIRPLIPFVFKGLDERNQWTDIDTYGGKLVENVVQATARDILGISMIRLHKKGYSIIGHVHDEVIIEAPEGQSIEVIEDIMGLPVEWAKDLPLAADGFVTPFYMKD